jgi:hypothetical protein
MRTPAGLHLDYVTPAEYRSARWDDVLGVATFNHSVPVAAPEPQGIPIAQVSTPVLADAAEVYEVWRCGAPAESGRHGEIHFRRHGSEP